MGESLESRDTSLSSLSEDSYLLDQLHHYIASLLSSTVLFVVTVRNARGQ
jgi:hypothetical protein